MVMTSYTILRSTKLSLGITCMFHIAAMMMFWAIFVWDARGATNPSVWLGPNSTNSYISNTADKVITSGVGIVAGCETIFTGLYMVAYAIKPDSETKYAGRV